jgi:hypothetical protein
MNKYSEKSIKTIIDNYCIENDYQLIDGFWKDKLNYVDHSVIVTFFFREIADGTINSVTLQIPYSVLDKLLIEERSNKIKNILNE